MAIGDGGTCGFRSPEAGTASLQARVAVAEELLLAMWVSHQAAEAEGSRAADAFELKSPTASSEVDTRVMNSRRLVLTLNARISRVSVLIATT